MPYLIGFVLALTDGGRATAMRLDRDNAFHPTALTAARPTTMPSERVP